MEPSCKAEIHLVITENNKYGGVSKRHFVVSSGNSSGDYSFNTLKNGLLTSVDVLMDNVLDGEYKNSPEITDFSDKKGWLWT